MSVLKTGSMVLGQANYHLFDILCNFLMIQTGVFSSRSMLNVPLWFLTPLLVCYILYYIITTRDKNFQMLWYIFATILGGIFVYYGYQYPIANERLGRGLYSFFLGVILHTIYKEKKVNINFAGKIILLGVTIGSLILLVKGDGGNLYLSITFCFIFILILILETPIIEEFFSSKVVKKFYRPLYNISYELFCSHYVLILCLALADRCFNIAVWYNTWGFFCIYILFSYALANIFKVLAHPFINLFLVKNQ